MHWRTTRESTKDALSGSKAKHSLYLNYSLAQACLQWTTGANHSDGLLL